MTFPRLFRLRLTSVSGFPLPWRNIRLPCSRLPVSSAESGICRISQVLDASFHAYHALGWTPADPREPHLGGSSVLASGSLIPSPSALSRLTGLYQALERAVSPAVYVIPVYASVISFSPCRTSSTTATLGTGGWLALPWQGFSPCRKRQASLGALTTLG